MQTITLNGNWQLAQAGKIETIPATVPGCVHTDLLAAGKIDDPYHRDNELQTLWIGETNWVYRRTFTVPADFLAYDRLLLRCEGLDTLATIKLNDHIVAQTDNMFRTWEFEVKGLLVAGQNDLSIEFAAPLPYVRSKNQERFLPAWGVGQHKLDSGGWIRKEPCNFGWDWGPMLTTCGIWRNISLVGFNTARLTEVQIKQDHTVPGQVKLALGAAIEQVNQTPLSASCAVFFNGQVVRRAQAGFSNTLAETELIIENPHLWWPNGMGEQPLYEIKADLVTTSGEVLDSQTKRIGLRTLRLDRHEDRWGQSFQFVVNGLPFFAKGANWIPADTFATRVTRDDYARLLQDCAAANMNMLRVWGGGIYEADDFYDLCDELGLCIWQDFMFACATYPTFDEAFMASVQAEAEDNVRRLRHHACLALWCGNNELEQGLVGPTWTETTMSWADYARLFDRLLPEVVQKLDPQRDYWPCSPHGPLGNREDWKNPDWGDAHLWDVWHGKQPFEWYRTCTHRFNSEFGFQSFPEPKTVQGYTNAEDRNITSFVMEHHQRSGIGNSTIIHYMLDWFRLPPAFEMTLWLSQILQGMAMKYAVEHWRRGMPRGMGTLYWQLNDCWPVASWSSIDSLGRWKALHYMARDFYAPLLVSGVEDLVSGTVEIHVTSDRLEAVEGRVEWRLTDLNGTLIEAGTREVRLPAQQNSLVQTLTLKNQLESYHPRQLLLWLSLSTNGEVVSTNLVLFARPKHLELPPPTISTEIKALDQRHYVVRLTTSRPALWAWLALEEIEARYSDNFRHISPDRPVEIIVSVAQPLTVEELRKKLEVRSLIDTYHERIR